MKEQGYLCRCQLKTLPSPAPTMSKFLGASHTLGRYCTLCRKECQGVVINPHTNKGNGGSEGSAGHPADLARWITKDMGWDKNSDVHYVETTSPFVVRNMNGQELRRYGYSRLGR